MFATSHFPPSPQTEVQRAHEASRPETPTTALRALRGHRVDAAASAIGCAFTVSLYAVCLCSFNARGSEQYLFGGLLVSCGELCSAR
ncbi:Hypothetical protein A7982_08236 [Minicystis rosea]|nr:Hypothetical protein A7982_08236 [Minicystis rosea]